MWYLQSHILLHSCDIYTARFYYTQMISSLLDFTAHMWYLHYTLHSTAHMWYTYTATFCYTYMIPILFWFSPNLAHNMIFTEKSLFPEKWLLDQKVHSLRQRWLIAFWAPKSFKFDKDYMGLANGGAAKDCWGRCENISNELLLKQKSIPSWTSKKYSERISKRNRAYSGADDNEAIRELHKELDRQPGTFTNE